MWSCVTETRDGGRGQLVSIYRNGAPASYDQVLRSWQTDESFCGFFIDMLASLPYTAYRWETPPVTTSTVGRTFEFVVLDCPGLDRPVDVRAFQNQFHAARDSQEVVAFPNLGNDAMLVVPLPTGDPSTYTHLAEFIRRGSDHQKHELWQAVGHSMGARLGSRPLWLSTAGMGISWLHIRLDSRPKYYGHRPYREAA